MADINSRWLQKGPPDDAFKECVAAIDYARKKNANFLLGKADVTMVEALKDATAFARVLLLYESKNASDVDTLYRAGSVLTSGCTLRLRVPALHEAAQWFDCPSTCTWASEPLVDSIGRPTIPARMSTC